MRKIKLLLAAVLSIFAWTGVMAQSGTQNDPFVVKSAADLKNLHNVLVSGSMNYVVMENDVDMAEVTDWLPLFKIADDSNGYPFIDFDGKGHVISNLTSNTTDQYDYCGLFGVLCGNVRNLGVKDANVTCTGGTGIIAGYLGHSTYGKPCYVENVWVTGKLTASGYCGGMFGNIADEAYITNCYANVEVTGSSDLTGGIIGRVRNKVVMNNVYAAGTINRGGGIIGGGFKEDTPAGTYKNVAVWNNTENNFGPVRDNEEVSSLICYDGNNFAELQKQVVAWDPTAWYCDMKEGSYPVLVDFLDPETKMDAQYEAALATIQEGKVYRISTTYEGETYYVTLAGGLTSIKDEAGFFTITTPDDGTWKAKGFRIDSGTDRFTNPSLVNDKANLNQDFFAHSTNDRKGWERQVLFLNEEGKYAIRSCNTVPGTSSWADAGRTFWTYFVPVVTPSYTYDPDYVWELDGPLTTINVTYTLYESDGTTKVGNPVVVKQEANSAVNIPASIASSSFYDYEASGTIGEEDCDIKVVRTFKEGYVHALTDLSNEKAYIIGCDRGFFLTKDGYLASTAHASLHGVRAKKFAIINYEDNYYMFSVEDKKFVTNNGSLSTMLVNGTEDAIKLDAKTDPYFLGYFVIGGTKNGLNTNGNDPYGYVINTWMNADPGNLYYMYEMEDFDPEFALEALKATFHPDYFVTYIVKDAAGNELFKSDPVGVMKGMKITSLPKQFQRPFTTYTDADVTIEDKETTVEFTATWNGPFKLSTGEDDVTWYNMTIRSDYSVFVDETEPYYPKKATVFQKINDEYQWAFAGNAYVGILVFNKAKGINYTLTKDEGSAVMREGKYFWTIGANGDGFTLKEPKTDYNCINQSGGATGPLAFWDSENSPKDNGSTFRISDVSTSFDWTISEAGFATMYVPVDAVVNDPDALPAPVGAWTFDKADDLLAGKGIATLKPAIEYPLLDEKKTIKEVETLEEANIKAAEGPATGNGAIFIPKGASLKMTHNVNATVLGTYTIMMDIKLADVENYTPLYQTNVNNTNDAELFVSKGKIGINYNGVGYAGEVVADKWHRIVIVAEDALPTIYLDGVQISQATKGDGRWEIDPVCYFFADEDGEDSDVITSELRFWDVALTAEQVASMGTAGVAVPEQTDIVAYTGKIQDNYLKLTEVPSTVPAYTPVVLKGTPGTYKFKFGMLVGKPLTCAEAVAIVDEMEDNATTERDLTVSGIITEVIGKVSKKQQSFWMADTENGGRVFEAFWANIPDGETPFEVGQKVLITGKLLRYVKNDAVTPEIKNANVTFVDNDLIGAAEDTEAAGKYVLAKPEGKNAGFYKADGGTIKAGKAYLQIRLGAADIKAFYFDLDSETAIETIAVEENNTKVATDGIYNLSGQRVNKAQKGIYIVNGKKVLF